MNTDKGYNILIIIYMKYQIQYQANCSFGCVKLRATTWSSITLAWKHQYQMLWIQNRRFVITIELVKIFTHLLRDCSKRLCHCIYDIFMIVTSPVVFPVGISDGLYSWWRHQMETFSALLAPCAGNSPVTGEFPAPRPVTRSFDVFSGLRLNKRLNNREAGDWFETPSRSLWRHCIAPAVGYLYLYQIVGA